MSVFVYIIRSKATGRLYCGQTSHLGRRLAQHNDPAYRLSKTTKRFDGPWELVWSKDCPDRSSATILERTIKKRGIARFLEAQPAESRRPCLYGRVQTSAQVHVTVLLPWPCVYRMTIKCSFKGLLSDKRCS